MPLPSPYNTYYYIIACKRYVNSYWCVTNSNFAFWNFLEHFLSIFDPKLIDSMDAVHA